MEGGTRTRCRRNILLRAGLTTGGDGVKHEWWTQLWARLVVQAGSQTVRRAVSGVILYIPWAAARHRGQTRVPTDLYIPFFFALILARPFLIYFSAEFLRSDVSLFWDRTRKEVWSQIEETSDLKNAGKGAQSLQRGGTWSQISKKKWRKPQKNSGKVKKKPKNSGITIGSLDEVISSIHTLYTSLWYSHDKFESLGGSCRHLADGGGVSCPWGLVS